jgi:[acyl-carrier-protein] S-malonyltransferase
MGRELAQAYPAARRIFEEGDELLGFALSRLCWEGPESELHDTVNTQPALLVHSAAALAVLDEILPGFQPAYAAGHSMGELSALVACRSLDYASALRLVRTRGELMKAAGEHSPGGMAAIIGLDIAALDRVCQEASAGSEVVQVANDNSPGQVVISGAKAALERVIPLAQAAGARKVIPLHVSIAAHSPLMARSQEAFNQAVEAAPIQDPAVPLVGNVTAQPLTSAGEIRSDLRSQLTHRVRWTETVQILAERGVRTVIEVGSGTVLTGLVKRITKEINGLPFGAPQDIEKLLEYQKL